MYSFVMMWMWVIALGVTLVGLVLVVRALIRADDAVLRLQAATDGTDALGPATAGLALATVEVAHSRVALHERAAGDPG